MNLYFYYLFFCFEELELPPSCLYWWLVLSIFIPCMLVPQELRMFLFVRKIWHIFLFTSLRLSLRSHSSMLLWLAIVFLFLSSFHEPSTIKICVGLGPLFPKVQLVVLVIVIWLCSWSFHSFPFHFLIVMLYLRLLSWMTVMIRSGSRFALPKMISFI